MKWLLLPLSVVLAGCQKKPAPAASAPLAGEAYVWQAPDRPGVAQAIEQSKGSIDRLHIRAAELKWNGTRFEIQQPVTRLPAAGSGLVIR
ncbi:MAG: hypothetical protein EOP88_18805, partial [Verrucomicrobiaceae bacterium]